MAPRKKRRRTDGTNSEKVISLKDKQNEEKVEKEGKQNEKNISKGKEQEPLKEAVNVLEETIVEQKDDEVPAKEECASQENITEPFEINCEDNITSSTEMNCETGYVSNSPVARQNVNTPDYSICGSSERNTSPEILYNAPHILRVPLDDNRTSPVTEEGRSNSPENSVSNLELNRTSPMADLAREVDKLLTPIEPDIESATNMSELPTNIRCEEESNSVPASIKSNIFGNDNCVELTASFHVDDINASQESRTSAKENDPKELENFEGPKNIDNMQPDRTTPIEIYDGPSNIGLHREAISCNNLMLPPDNAPTLVKDFQGSRTRIIRIDSGSSESCTNEQILQMDVVTQPSVNSLSVWSDIHPEYLPSGKPSDLGELLEFPTRFVVRAWLKNIKLPIAGSEKNIAVQFCPECHRKFCYNQTDVDHLCSFTRSDPKNKLKLIFCAELEIYDETGEKLKVALAGSQAIKLFGCKPEEFLESRQIRKRIWQVFRHLLKGGNTQNLCLKDAADFSLEPQLKRNEVNYRVMDIRPFGPKFK